MRARYSPSDQRQVGSTGVASRTGLGTEPGSMGGRRSVKRAYITTKHYLKEGKHHVCCWSGKQTIWFNLWGEYSHDRLLSKEKTKSYHPPPLHLAPKRWLASRFTCEFENKFGSRAHRARKEWVARWRVHGQNFPPTRTSEVSSESKAPTNLFNEFHNFFICISVIRL